MIWDQSKVQKFTQMRQKRFCFARKNHFVDARMIFEKKIAIR